VPFLCDIRRASRITDATRTRRSAVSWPPTATPPTRSSGTLAYFDGRLVRAAGHRAAFLSAALDGRDLSTSTVFGAYHELAGPSPIHVWEYNGHEGGGPDDDERAIRALAELFDSE
jgi:cephalosporin-C deacetylase